MNVKPLHILIVLLLSTCLLKAQEHSNSPKSVASIIQETPRFNSATNNGNSQNSIANSRVSNSRIYVQQVGTNNEVVSNTTSLINNTNILQTGSQNQVVQKVTALSINDNIVQTGFNHKVFDINGRVARAHNTSVIQYGANQKLIVSGENSISKNMVVRMSGKGQSILIRNLKN
ncbi:MAG: hypothetical protein CMC13_02450 [Flavobacteriaceae bacterium]|nr:hypothetical protein [Flavobacteriaceae bacterium]|tara:strand:+ start:2108 stop:2629 length:522 start_codon:yes stop_codon:yes gene_type:complete